MANSYSQYAISGTTYSVTFDYLKESHITVYVDEALQSSGWSVVGSNVVFDTEPTGTTVTIRRTTPKTLATQLVDFADGAVLTENDLDTAQRQLLYIAQEAFERDKDDNILPDAAYLPYGTTDGKWDAAVSGNAKPLKNLLDDSDLTSAATRGYVESLSLYGVVGNPKTFTGTIATGEATYTLTGMGSQTYIDASMLVVSMGGVLQVPGTDYSIAGTDDGGDAQIVFSPTPGSGDAGTTFSVVNFGSARLGGVADGSVETEGLADDAVTAAKLADSPTSSASRAVSADHIQDSAVTTTRIADDAVTAAKLATDSVTGDAIAADSITFGELKATDFYTGSYAGSAPYVLRIAGTGDLTAGPLDGTEIPNLSNAVASLPISDMGLATDHVQMGDGTDNYQIKNLLTPSADSDAATKAYVDNLAGGTKIWSPGVITIDGTLVARDTETTLVSISDLPSDLAVLIGVTAVWAGDEAEGTQGLVGVGLSGTADNGTASLRLVPSSGSWAFVAAEDTFTSWTYGPGFDYPPANPRHGVFTTAFPSGAFASGCEIQMTSTIGSSGSDGFRMYGSLALYFHYIAS